MKAKNFFWEGLFIVLIVVAGFAASWKLSLGCLLAMVVFLLGNCKKTNLLCSLGILFVGSYYVIWAAGCLSLYCGLGKLFSIKSCFSPLVLLFGALFFSLIISIMLLIDLRSEKNQEDLEKPENQD